MRIWFVVGMVAIVSLFSRFSPCLASDLGGLRLSRLEGVVQFQSRGNEEWYPATGNLPLQDGDRLWVPRDAWAQLETRSGTVVRLDAESSLEILEAGDGNSLHVYLSQGQAYCNYLKTRDSMVQVDTTASSVRVYDSSTLNIAIVGGGRARDENTEVSVYRGVALVENREGEIMVSAGKMLATDNGSPFLVGLDNPNGWERWNHHEDEALLGGGDDSRYLPPELSQYGRELNRNGRWVSTTEYGSVWMPTTNVTVDWVPYRHGRWMWIGNDFVWVGEEPWGWAPYHYGRWAHVPRYGWCWVPPPRHEVYWGPGFVNWVQTTTTVAWVPLAPREVYYGYGYYGPNSMNIFNININNYQRIDGRRCRNAFVDGAVTSYERDSFVKGHYRRTKENDNPFLSEPIHIGRPQIEPHHAMKMPVVKDIPLDRRPPEHVRSYSQLPEEALRTMVKDRRRSVFNPVVTPPLLTPPVEDKKREGISQDLPVLHRQGAPNNMPVHPAIKDDKPVFQRQGIPAQSPLGDKDEREKYPVFGGRPTSEQQDLLQRSLPHKTTPYGGSGRFRENRPDQMPVPTMPVNPEPVPVHQPKIKADEQGAYPVFQGRSQIDQEMVRQRVQADAEAMKQFQQQQGAQQATQQRNMEAMKQFQQQQGAQQATQQRNMEAMKQYQQQQAAQQATQQRNMEAMKQYQQQQAAQQATQQRNMEAMKQYQQQQAAQQATQQRNMEAMKQYQQQQAAQQATQQRNMEAMKQYQQQQAAQQATQQRNAEAMKQYQQQAAQQAAEEQQGQQGNGYYGRGSLQNHGRRP